MLKRLSLWLLAAFFAFCVLAVAISASTNSVLGKPDSLKDSLADSNVYDNIAAGFVDQAVEETSKQQPGQTEGIQLTEETMRDVADRVITPAKVQGYAEQIIDGTYDWLEGDTEQPSFELDLDDIQKDLGNAAGDVAVNRVKKLPACTLQQLQTTDLNNIDPFNLPCRPPGINLETERAKLVKEFTSNENALGEDSTFTAEDIGTDEVTGQNAFDNLSILPTMFQLSQILPWILGVLGVLAGAGIVFFNENRRKGLKKVSLVLLTSGILLLVGIWLASALFGSMQFDGTADDQMREAMTNLVRTLNAEFNRTLLIFAVVYSVVGAGGLIGLRLTRPKETGKNSESPEEKSAGHKNEEKSETKTYPDDSLKN